jgi:hypothetical protein
MMAGLVLAIVPFGGLIIVPLLLTGLLVGEVMSTLIRRRTSQTVAVLAFVCTVVGPLMGRALLAVLLSPGADAAVRAAASFEASLRSLGLFGLLLLLAAGAIAYARVNR